MATPRRNDELTDGGRNADERYSNEAPRSNSQKVQSKIMQGGSPLTTKARQVQRRYRSLFHQGAKEYQGWCEGEADAQRALGSVCHLLDRLRMLEPGLHQDGDGTLGGLANLPGCRTLLIRKHTVELERVMRLWRALVQQMKGQVSRIEEALADAWQLHRHEAVTRARVSDLELDSARPRNAILSPDAGTRGQATMIVTATAVAGGSAVGPAEYLQWLGDMSSMLVHEQWRKEALLSKVDFGPDDSSQRVRMHAKAHWSSRSTESLLDRALIDNALDAAQVVPLSKSR